MGRQTRDYATPYILCDLLDSVQLTEDNDQTNVHITCVDFWESNLYIGTSAGEILHYVQIPTDATDATQSPSFILASRLRPEYAETAGKTSGVERILLLPDAAKACILCNGTLNFYVLPELSPAYGGTKRVPRCSWVDGLDQYPDLESSSTDRDGQEIIICDATKIRIVRIGQKAAPVRAIQLGGCRAVLRKGSIACAADLRAYSLLEVVQQQAIPLFEVSPQQDQQSDSGLPSSGKPLPSLPAASDSAGLENNAGKPTHATDFSVKDSNAEGPREGVSEVGEERKASAANETVVPPRSTSLPSPEARQKVGNARQQHSIGDVERPTSSGRQAVRQERILQPHIASPNESEFLLTTGTSMSEEGVGIFVNLDGDVVRGTLQFDRYPEALITDGDGIDAAAPATPGQPRSEGYVLAVIDRGTPNVADKTVEMQRWDLDPADNPTRYYLEMKASDNPSAGPDKLARTVPLLGIGKAMSITTVTMTAIIEKLDLTLTRLDSSAQRISSDHKRPGSDSAESDFVKQMSQMPANILCWSDSTVRWVVKTPVILRLDARLDEALTSAASQQAQEFVQRSVIEQVIGDLRDQEAADELEFLSFKYLRQKASLLLTMDLVGQVISGNMTYERDRRVTMEILVHGDIDPRLIIGIVPGLRNDVLFNDDGLWLQRGIAECVTRYYGTYDLTQDVVPGSPLTTTLYALVKDYLYHWKRKKGFGSIADESHLFQSVDAALLHILLTMDSTSPTGRAVQRSSRAELKALVTEGVDCFQFAVNMLEQFQRLYVLSLLYMSRRQFAKVLETWKRIMEGETDLGGELGNGEEEMRNFLKRRKDRALVEEYGCWLASRNPKFGAQVFADDTSQVRFEPRDAIRLLETKVPDAVKGFIEYLVFEKKLPQYANDLIGYYLDFVTAELDANEESRSLLRSTNEAYRALIPPKPTYSQFVTDNAIDADWWHNRLHLLRLLGGSHEAASQYDVDSIAERLARHKEELVPETIVLSGRQGRHEEAIRLLTHRLGDFDTAISYCVLGGWSTYSPISSRQRYETMPTREEQMALFRCLLEEFFRIEDLNDRISQTSELLERFSGWFDVEHVLTLVPGSWSVDKVSAFLESSLRELLTERNETLVSRALTSCANLSANGMMVEKITALGASVDRDYEKQITHP